MAKYANHHNGDTRCPVLFKAWTDEIYRKENVIKKTQDGDGDGCDAELAKLGV